MSQFNPNDRPPRVKLARLSEFISKSSGRSYWSGYLGGVKVIAITSTDEPTVPGSVGVLDLFIEEAPPRTGKLAGARQARPAPSQPDPVKFGVTAPATKTAGDESGDGGPPWA